MGKTGTRRKFDKDFKIEAVQLANKEERKITDVANNLGIDVSLLYRWKRQYSKDSDRAFPGKGHLKPQDEEIRQLKRELADVKEERDILKKALAIFSRAPG